MNRCNLLNLIYTDEISSEYFISKSYDKNGCFLDRLLLLDFNLFHPDSKGKQKMGDGNKQFDVS